MKYSGNARLAILFTITLFTGCASSGITATGSTDSTASDSSTGNPVHSTKSDKKKPDAEPECD